MKIKNSTKQSLLVSVLSMLVCVAMLIGTTFAWFTDSASTAVNKIQAGTLDVALEMYDGANWVTAEGKTLQFKVNGAIPAAGTQILWEPGCTYELPELRVVNKGNLALKYKVIISGIQGDATLNDVIDWTINDAPINLVEKHLAANTADTGFVIKGHMQEAAGNEYQGLSIDGIGITVVATQDTVEFDSITDQYDKDALYPVLAPVLNNSDSIHFTGTPATETKIENDKAVSKIPASTEIYETASATTPIVPAADGELQRVLKTTASSADSVTYDIAFNYLSGGTATEVHKFGNVVENIVQLSTGLKEVKVHHSGTAMTEATTKADGTYYYDDATGKLYIYSSTYSSYTVSYKSDFVASVNGQGYSTLTAAISAANGSAKVVLLKDITLSETLEIANGTQVKLDLYGKTLAAADNVDDVIWNYGDLTVMDTSSEQSGKIYVGNRGYRKGIGIKILDDSKTTILSGTVETDGAYAIYLYVNKNNPAQLNIHGGTIIGSYYGVYSAAVNNGSATGAEIIMTDGTVATKATEFNTGSSVSFGNAFMLSGVKSCTISGGTVKSERPSTLNYGSAFSAYGDMEVLITGGTFTGEAGSATDSRESAGYAIAADRGSKITISPAAGKNVVLNGSGMGLRSFGEGSIITMNGGEITTTNMVTETNQAYFYGKIIVNDGIVNSNTTALFAFAGGEITVNGGTVNAKEIALYAWDDEWEGGGTVSVTGGNIVGGKYGLYVSNDNNTVNISGGNFTAQIYYPVYFNYTSTPYTITGGAFVGKYTSNYGMEWTLFHDARTPAVSSGYEAKKVGGTCIVGQTGFTVENNKISSGTFTFDVTPYAADGKTVTRNGNFWTVS